MIRINRDGFYLTRERYLSRNNVINVNEQPKAGIPTWANKKCSTHCKLQLKLLNVSTDRFEHVSHTSIK